MNGTFDEKSVTEEKKPDTKKRSTTKTTKQQNIFQRLLSVVNALTFAYKSMAGNAGGQADCRTVSERDVLEAIKSLEVEYGIYSYPSSREIVEERVKTIYRFVNVDNPEDYMETTVLSERIDAQSGGVGRAVAYGDEQALKKAYKISTEDTHEHTASVAGNQNAVKKPVESATNWRSKSQQTEQRSSW